MFVSRIKSFVTVNEETAASVFAGAAVLVGGLFYIHVADKPRAPVKLGAPQAVDMIQVGCLTIHKGDSAGDALAGTERLEVEVDTDTKLTKLSEPITRYYSVDGALYAITISVPKGSNNAEVSGLWDVTIPSGKVHQEQLAHTSNMCLDK